jgi:HK97 gp10 family phage protein
LFDVKWELKGFDRVISKMRSLSPALRGKAGRSAIGTAARVVTNAAKQNAQRIDDPETGRTIAANIAQRLRSKHIKATGDLKVSVGVATNKGRIPSGNPDEGPRGNTPHWHLVELGTERARAQPFLRPALENNIGKVQEVFAAALEKQIDKAVK